MAKFTGNPILSQRFGQALQYAHDLHIKQIRKGKFNEPYIAHLLTVASIVLENGGDETMAIAALLHDAVEDIKIDISDIAQLFGESVASIVDSLSEDKYLPTKKERKQSYISKIKTGGAAIALISCADKLHNARSYVKSPELITPDIIWFYEQLLPLYSARVDRSLVGEMQELLEKMKSATVATAK